MNLLEKLGVVLMWLALVLVVAEGLTVLNAIVAGIGVPIFVLGHWFNEEVTG